MKEHIVQTQTVLFEERQGVGGDLGVITLNRPDVLNSLNQQMIHALHAQLNLWARDPHIKAVVIQATEGRAFCAGGDLSLIYEAAQQTDSADKALFFRDEYHLNAYIHHFPKPYIALLDGITMGGGVGISIHGSHVIATERLTFAMPETGIGFFPDVGGTYFLPRLKHYMGFYLGLTGHRIKADDCVRLGIAHDYVPKDKLSQCVSALQINKLGKQANEVVSELISDFAAPIQQHDSVLLNQQALIEECFSATDVESIIERLENRQQSFADEVVAHLRKKSPTSLKVTLRALQKGKNLNFDECMRQEFRLTNRFLTGNDFVEGIRAVIIDKDRQPNWQPNVLADVSETMVEDYFAPLAQEL